MELCIIYNMIDTRPVQNYFQDEFDDFDKIEDQSKAKIKKISLINVKVPMALKHRPSTHTAYFKTYQGKLTDTSTQIFPKRAITKLIKVPFKYSCYQLGNEIPTQSHFLFMEKKNCCKDFSATQTYSPLLIHTFYKTKPKAKASIKAENITKPYLSLFNINKNSIFLPSTFLTNNTKIGYSNLIKKLNGFHTDTGFVPPKVRRSVSCSRRNRNTSVHNTQDIRIL